MKRWIITLLSVALIISVGFNIFLLRKSNSDITNEEDSTLEDTVNISSFPQELIGTWHGTASRVVEIKEDGTVYWMWVPEETNRIYSGLVGVVNGTQFIFTKKYEGDDNYESLTDIPESEFRDVSILYDITLYGDTGFSAQNANQTEKPYSFTKWNE